MAHRVDHVTAQNNLFTEGNPGSGQPATVVPAAWLNDTCQEEICKTVEAEGITLVKADNTQLKKAIARRAARYGIGFRNKLINGSFAFWKRWGTSKQITSANGSSYVADRWRSQAGSSAGTATISQQTHPNGTPGLGLESGLRYLRHDQSVASGGSQPNLEQRVIEFEQLDGRTVTFSCWLKVAAGGANVIARLAQKFDNNGVGDTQYETTWAVTTTWTKFSFTQLLGSAVGKTTGTFPYVAVSLILPGGATFILDVAMPQLECGDEATEFEVRPGVIENHLCSFYYWKSYPDGTVPGGANSFGGQIISPDQLGQEIEGLNVRFPYAMRVVPTLTWYSPATGTSGKVQAQAAVGVYSDYDVTGVTGLTQVTSGFPTVGAPTANGAPARAHLTADAEI